MRLRPHRQCFRRLPRMPDADEPDQKGRMTRRPSRRLFALAAAVSLALCVASLMFWMRSYWGGDVLRWYGRPYFIQVESNQGLLRVAAGELVLSGGPTPPTWMGSFWPFRRGQSYYNAGFVREARFGFNASRFVLRRPDIRAGSRSVTFPHWLAALCLAAPPALSIWRWRYGRRRSRLGLCPVCAYDLRATAGRCPECGTPVAAVRGAP